MKREAKVAGARRYLILALAAVAVIAAIKWGMEAAWRSVTSGSRPLKEDPFVVVLPNPTPEGEAVKPAMGLAAGDEFRGKGTFSYRRDAGGTFGSAPPVRNLEVGGTFTSTRRVEADSSGRLVVSVDADLVVTPVEGDKAKSRREKLTISFPDGVPGPMSVKGAKLEVADDLREVVEPLVEVFTSKPPLPDRAVRVGESFAPKEALDLEPMRRQMWFLFRYDNRGVAPVEGLVWVEGRVDHLGEWMPSRGGLALEVGTLLHQEQEGLVSDTGKPKITTRCETVVRGRYAIEIADGAPREVQWTNARRLHVVGRDFDYHVELSLSASLHERRTARR